jgi:hypothetical protein
VVKQLSFGQLSETGGLWKNQPGTKARRKAKPLGDPADGVLSIEHGGIRTDLRGGYCLFYRYRPPEIDSRLLCSGSEDWGLCPDHGICWYNEPEPEPKIRPPLEANVVVTEEEESDGEESGE